MRSNAIIRPLILLLLIAVTALQASAASLSLTPSTPVPGGHDIFNFSGGVADTNNVYATGGAPIANGGDNDSYTYVDASRTTQGQTFTTGGGNGAYVLTDIWIKHAGYSANSSNTFWMMAGGGNLTLRITKPSQAGTAGFVLSSETYVTTGAEGWSTSGTGSLNGDGMWLHFTLASPVTLAAGATYGFDLKSGNPSAFFEWLGSSDDALNGAAAYKGTSSSPSDNTLSALVGDRVFLVGLTPAASSPLTIQMLSAGQMEISWAAINASCVLEASSTGASNSWSSNGLPVPSLVGGIKSVVVPTSGDVRFFRLSQSPDFSLSANPADVTLSPGSQGVSTITINPLGAFSGSVSLFASGLPGGVTASFSPGSAVTTSTLTLTANGSPAVGSVPVTITGTNGALSRTMTINLTVNAAAGGFYTWPAYSPNIAYDFVDEYGIFNQPTTVMPEVTGVAGTYTNGWWAFRYGSNKNPLVTSNAWVPMLTRFNTDFAYITDILRWPRDPRAQNGYFSTIYLYGSGLSTDNASNTALGGWQSGTSYLGKSWPMVLLSYYPVYSFDPACPYGDRVAQQGASVHEGIHCILAGMPGCYNSAWTGEGGNTWLQGTMDSQRAGNYGDFGWLSSGAALAQFMPIECYSGWLQDGSFGGPSAQGVNMYSNSVQLCTWRNLLGGTQYGECPMRAMDSILGPKSVAWVYRYCNKSGRLLQDMAEQTGSLGPVQTRRYIQEYRGRFAMCDFGRWSYAFSQRLKDRWNQAIQEEYSPYWIDVPVWNATCYVAATNVGGTLYPEARTLPGWSGANQIPLTVSGTVASVTFNPLGSNMSCQLVYRDTGGAVRYSFPVSSGVCSIPLSNVLNNVVIAVVCNTDYTYVGEYSRTNKFNYTLTPGSGITGQANIYSQWFNYTPATYTITASVSGPGAISSPGVTTLASGATKTYTLTPGAGYSILNVLVSGIPVGPVTNYTFTNIHGSSTIQGQFGIKTKNIYASSSGVGTVSPAGLSAVTAGANQTYTVIPNPGWAVYSLTVDGTNQGALSNYTFNNVQADHNIKASYSGSNPSIPQAANLWFAAVTDTLPASGSISGWDAYFPAGFSLSTLQSPVVETISGAKWELNSRTDSDGFGVISTTNAIACNGATIVVAVKPVRNATADAWNSVVDCFYNNLVISVRNSSGEIRVHRNGTQVNTGAIIPDGQRTVLALVVQSTGAYKVFANGTQVYSTATPSAFTQFAPGAQSYMKAVTIGRNSPDTWSAFNGNIGDLYVYKIALTDTDRAALEGVIRTKFGF